VGRDDRRGNVGTPVRVDDEATQAWTGGDPRRRVGR
jgi:hypothetical protein